MTNKRLMLFGVATLIVAFLASEIHSQSVVLMSLRVAGGEDVRRLIEGDGLGRTVTVTAVANKLTLSVRYWPPDAPYGSPGVDFITNYTVADNDTGRDGDPKPGFISAQLPKPFDQIGKYVVRDERADRRLMLLHIGRGLWQLLLSFPVEGARFLLDLNQAASRGGDRGRSIEAIRPEAVGIWTAHLPQAGREIAENDLALSVKSAMMPAWSSDGTVIVCSVRNQQKWVIAAYRFEAGRELAEVWRWVSPQPGHDLAPVWAPDGNAVAFARMAPDGRGGVWVLNLDQARRPQNERLLVSLEKTPQIVGWEKGMGILFELGVEQQSSAGETDLWAVGVPEDRQAAVPRLVPLSLPFGSLLGRAPSRQSVIFALDFPDDSPPTSELREISVDRQQKRLVAGEPKLDRAPAVSPDGQWLAFDSDRTKRP